MRSFSFTKCPNLNVSLTLGTSQVPHFTSFGIKRKFDAGADMEDPMTESSAASGRAQEIRDVVSENLSARLACPFFQKDPTKFRGRRPCSGPGFLSTARVR